MLLTLSETTCVLNQCVCACDIIADHQHNTLCLYLPRARVQHLSPHITALLRFRLAGRDI